MKNIEMRGTGFRAQVYRRGVRVSKTFSTADMAAQWVAERKQEVRDSGRLARLFPPRPFYLPPPKPSGDLLSRNAIAASAAPRRPVCGVYFLLVEDDIMYVGQSTDVHHRLGVHARTRTFDAVHIIECPREKLPYLESRYIAALQPPWNIGRRGLVLSVHRSLV